MALASQKVIKWLIKYIKSNQLQKGDVLPSETQISQMLNLSRVPVREAFAALKAFGVAISRQGIGLTLTADPRRLDMMMLFSQDKFNVSDYYQARQFKDFLENGAVDEIINNAKSTDIKNLSNLIDRLEGNAEPHLTPEEFEVEFHKLLSSLSENKFFIAFSLLYEPLFHTMVKVGKSGLRQDALSAEAIENHRKIIHAIESRDNEALLAIMKYQKKCLYTDKEK